MANKSTYDKKVDEMEKVLTEMYKDASVDIGEKWTAYMDATDKKLKDIQSRIAKAQKDGDTDSLTDLQYEYKRQLQNQTLGSARFESMAKETAAKLTKINETAISYLNGQMAGVYATAFNELGGELENVKGYSFALINEETVQSMIDNGDKSLLPAPSGKTLAEILQKSVDTEKDAKWNMKMINSQVMQGILQGESVNALAGRLMNVTDMNLNSAVRNARTMVTNASNKGRLDGSRQAVADGINLVKIWQSGEDERTRPEHIQADRDYSDGIPIDEPFIVGGEELMYPGDSSGSPAMVYNCRCTLIRKVLGFDGKKLE